MALSDSAIRNAKPGEKPYKLFDGGGLFLLVNATGGKLWRLKYRFGGKEKLLAIGIYPDLSRKDARERREEARKLLANDVDPGADKKRKATAATIAAGNTFKSVADEFITKREKDGLAEATVTKAKWFLSILDADIGKRPMSEIEPSEILASLKKIEKLGNNETAKRVRAFTDRVFRFAIISGYAKHNPAIQATSRVGRAGDKPGLVITLLNLHKPRDRTHYEQFRSFHASFYRSVEATSVTPFAPRALDRALAALVVAAARHIDPEMTPSNAVSRLSQFPYIGERIGVLSTLRRVRPLNIFMLHR